MMLVFSVQSSFPKIARNGGDKTPAVLVFRKGRRKRERTGHHFSLCLSDSLSLSKCAKRAHNAQEITKMRSHEILILYKFGRQNERILPFLKKFCFSLFLCFVTKKKEV